MFNKLLHFLIIVLLVCVLSGCNILNYGFSKNKGEITFKFDELTRNETKVIEIKKETDLEFGYNKFKIDTGQVSLKILENNETIIFEQKLDKNSPDNGRYKLKNLKPGQYIVQIHIEDATSGQINIFWNSFKINF